MDTLAFPELLGWVAADDGHLFHVLYYYTATAHYGSFAYTTTGGEDKYFGGNPHVVLDGDAVVLVFPVGGVYVVGSGDNLRSAAYDDMTAYMHGVAQVQLRGLYRGVITDYQIGIGAFCQLHWHDDLFAYLRSVLTGYAARPCVFPILKKTRGETFEVTPSGTLLDVFFVFRHVFLIPSDCRREGELGECLCFCVFI